MHKDIWRYGAMKAVLRFGDDGLIQVEVIGLVSVSSVGCLRRDCVLAMSLPGARAMVVDFRRASVLLSIYNLPMPALPIPEAKAAMPVAVVCGEVDEALFVIHAQQSAKQGLTRAVFTDPAAAREWVWARADGTSAMMD